MGNFAENLNLGNRFRPPPRTLAKATDQQHERISARLAAARLATRFGPLALKARFFWMVYGGVDHFSFFFSGVSH